MHIQTFGRVGLTAMWLLIAGIAVFVPGCPPGTIDPPPGQGDSDNDGVIDADDDCPSTPAGAQVDGNGCPVDLDSDDDGVVDADDDCPNTPTGTAVDANGCPIQDPTEDDDNDTVINADDDCPNTLANAVVDANGCSEGQRDDDGDEVPNADDDCPNTTAGAIVDANGCPVGGGDADSDNDGVDDDRDRCPNTPAGTNVDDFGCPRGGGGGNPVCGNEVVEAGEECEPPNSTTCDSDCQAITRITANSCAQPEELDAEGTFVFDNGDATQDGPAHSECVSFGSDQIDHDVWSCWTSPCNGTVFVRTCGLTAVDTKLAVYDGCACPPTDNGLLSCNDDACSSTAVQSLVTFEAISGQSYLIRLGTFPGEPGGVGGVFISCSVSSCGGAGDCEATHATPGCSDRDCCEKTCAIDPFCCDVNWDDTCVDQAQGLCSGSFSACQPGLPACTRGTVCSSGSNEGRPCGRDSDCPGGGTCDAQPGCGDVDCCNSVCQVDPFCCLSEWDNVCAEREAAMCHSVCGPDAGDPFTVHGTPGSNDEACCGEVCLRDPVCCQTDWDQTCVDLAEDHCR